MTCRFENATDEQLKMIMKEDKDCPVDLLRGVVTEMMNRGLLEDFAISTILRRFETLEEACKQLNETREDLIQFAYMKIWESIDKFQPGRGTFAYYSFVYTESKFKDRQRKRSWGKYDMDKHTSSFDQSIGDGDTLEMFLVSPYGDTERAAIKNIMLQEIEEKMKGLTEMQQQTIRYFVKGYEVKEMSEILGRKRQNIERSFHRAIEMMGGTKFNLRSKREGVA